MRDTKPDRSAVLDHEILALRLQSARLALVEPEFADPGFVHLAMGLKERRAVQDHAHTPGSRARREPSSD